MIRYLLTTGLAALSVAISAQSVTLWPPTGTVDTFEYANMAAIDPIYDAIDPFNVDLVDFINHTPGGAKSL